MRKLILTAIAAAVLMPAGAGAQSYGEVRRGQREVHESRRDLNDARRYGGRGDVREARQELREDRRELREDWRDYRRSNPQAFRGRGYDGPRGYRYRPVGVGHRFQPTYYDRRYQVDYRTYRLARPNGSQRWVRYGNDVVLVDARSGRVVQVHDRFFY